jgi:hypothetical protein
METFSVSGFKVGKCISARLARNQAHLEIFR